MTDRSGQAMVESTGLGARTWRDIDRTATLLVPLGSTEQHGPHLPLDTDTRIAVAIAEAAADQLFTARHRAHVAPALAYGASGEHQGFAGTLSIGTEALHLVLVELVRSATETFGRVVLVNGHGGNHHGVDRATKQLRGEGRDVTAWSPRIPGGDAHAGRTETSLMLAIAPEVVALDQAEAGNPAPLAELMADLRHGGVAAVSANGVLGDPAGASAARGHELLTRLAADLAAVI